MPARIGIWDWDISTDSLVGDDLTSEIHAAGRQRFTAACGVWLAAVRPPQVACAEPAIGSALRRDRPDDITSRNKLRGGAGSA